MKFVPRRLVYTRDNSKGKPILKDWVKGLLSLGVFFVFAYFALGWTADVVANNISEETEAKLFQWLDVGDALSHQAEFAHLQEIFNRLKDAPDLRPLPYRLVMLEMEGPNAFALPGGTIGVTPALLDEVKSEIGLAFVLAHELGHQQHRHALKRLGRTLIYRIAMGWISGAGDLSLLNYSLSLATLKHSRDQESEADQFGLALVYQTYGTTEGAFEFFEDMHALHGDGNKLGAMFQTHPLSEQRLADLEQSATELRGPIERL
ncbi:MAG: M48 family metallopeptidase [Planctomycetes bacterium]|nr:M48 family metallopeptidase [Planctomycetota bacterium]